MDTKQVPRVTVAQFDANRKRLARDLIWWPIGCVIFTMFVILLMLTFNWIRI